MKRPKQIRNVDAEVTHWSDDISGEVVLEIVTAPRKPGNRENHQPQGEASSRDAQ